MLRCSCRSRRFTWSTFMRWGQSRSCSTTETFAWSRSGDGLDAKNVRVLLAEDMSWSSLATVERCWEEKSSSKKKAILTGCLGFDTVVVVYKGTILPHDFASDTNAIQNPDLVSMLYDDSAFCWTLSTNARKSKSRLQ